MSRFLKSKRRWLILLVAMVALTSCQWYDGEPRYQGRSLSSWLDDYNSVQVRAGQDADVAIHAMGTNASPWLMKYMLERESWADDVKGSRNYYEWSLWRFPRLDRRSKAKFALAESGSAAAPVLPLLLAAAETPPYDAAFVLGRLSTNATPQLLQLLRSTNADELGQTLFGMQLAFSGQSPPPDFVASVEPLMIGMTRHANESIRTNGVNGLIVLGPVATNAIPVAIKLLADHSVEVASEAVVLLVLSGESAVPAVRQAMLSPDWQVRFMAQMVLDSIETAKNTNAPAR